MIVISLRYSYAVGVMKTTIEFRDFANCLSSTFDGEKIQHRRGHKNRPRIHHEKQSRVVNVIRNHAVQILLRITVGVLENAVGNSHWKRGDITGNRGHLNPGVQSSNVRGLK